VKLDVDNPGSRLLMLFGFYLLHQIIYLAVARGLAARGWTVSCCQLAGHCGTEEDLLATGWADWFASSERAMAELERECDTIVVGGVFKTVESVAMSGVPVLSQIPFLGWLFKYETKSKTTRELLVFITPRIIKDAP
jgi:hypothetical protein